MFERHVQGKKGRRLIGASTITQQVAKNFLLNNDYSIDRKLKEALVAQRRITRKSGGYVRVPHEGPTPGKGYKGFDPLGGLEI